MDRNSVKDFVIPSNSKALVQENVDRVRLLFTVEVSFTSNDSKSGIQWVNLRGNEEDRERAQTYIMSLCNQEVMNTIKLPRGLFNELRTDEKRSEIERLSCALVSFSDPETSEVSVYGSDIPVAMAVSVFEERLCVFSKQNGLDKFATTDGCLEVKAEKSSDTAKVCPTMGSDLNDQIHRAESATDIPPSMREFARKIKYTDNEIDVVVRTFGPEITINELLQELVKNSSSARQNGAASDDTKQLPVIRGNSVSSAPIRAEYELVARGCAPAMRSRRPEAEQAIPQADIYRPIVIDGSNVAMNHGNQELFSCRGIQLCVQYFARRGHQDITVFVPMWRKEESRPGSLIQNQEVLHELSRRNILKFTPSRSNGNRRIVCYDDKYIVDLAEQNGGIIVSNDNFRDLLKENPRWKEAIEQRTLMYTFVGDRFMPPDDPLGRRGPSLDDFLRKGTSTHPRICPYLKNCTFGHRCKYYHPERDTRRQQITNSSPPENTVQHSSAGETTITTTSSHSPCQSRLISTNGSHGTITGEQRVSTPPRDVPYFQEHPAFENRGRRPEGITARGRDMQPPPGVAPYERSRVLGPDEQVNPHYRGGNLYHEFRHPVPQEYGRTTQRYGNPVPNPVYPNMYPQPAAQWPPYAAPVPYRNGYPAVMGHHAGQQPPYVNTFAYYEPATVPYGNLLGGAASRDRVDGTEDSKKEHCPVSKELLDSLVEKLKEISPREDVIVRVLLSHPSECEKRDLDALAGLVIDALVELD